MICTRISSRFLRATFTLFAMAISQPAVGDSVVVFNEVMYHPATNEASLEWVELHNQMAVDVDISAWTLRGGITYDFPSDTILSGGAYAVIAIDPNAVESAHGVTNVFGPFSGRLSNAGETLRLRNHDGRVMNEFSYNDGGDWPPAADGSGVSLSKIDRDMGTVDPANWGWSLTAGGTPGGANAVYRPEDAPGLVFNEIASATNVTFWVELHNAATTSVSVGGYRIASTGFAAGDYTLPAQTLAPGAFLVLDATTLGFRAYDEDKLFLYDAASTVRDAVIVKNSPRSRYPDGNDDWFRSPSTTAGASNVVTLSRDIVINEIMYHAQPSYAPYTESDQEWIELYNRGTDSVDLAGWALDKSIGFTFSSNTVLVAGEYLVVAKATHTFQSAFPAITNVVGGYSGRLANGGDRVVLRDAIGHAVDDVTFSDGRPWPEFADGGGTSLELRDPDADNANASAWAASDETAKSAWQTVTYRGTATEDGIGHNIWHEFCVCLLGAGEVLMDDISVVEDPDGSAIEFMQNGGFQSDGLGSVPATWRLLGTHGSHGRSIVVDDPASPGNKVLRLVSTGDYKHEHNHAETTFFGGEQVVAGREYEISFRVKWLAGSPQVNTRLYFNWLQRTTRLTVPLTHGTPGRVNSQRVANAGPTFAGLAHAPVVPASSQDVLVTVAAADPDGVTKMDLYYAVDGGAWQTNAMSLADGKYVGTIPGRAASARVQFYVQGEDSLGAAATYPAAGPESRAMFGVQDGLADLGVVHNLRIVMTTADTDAMYATPELMSNYRRGGTVIYDEQFVYYDVAIRPKGSPAGRSGPAGRGFNIAFHDDLPFRGVHSTLSIERFPTLKEVVAKHMFSKAGGGLASLYDDAAHIVTPRASDTGRALLSMARYTDVFLDAWVPNGSEGNIINYELLYTPSGTVDGHPESLKRTNPYTHTSGAPDLADYGEDAETYRWNFQLRNNRRQDDYSAVIDLCQAFSLTGDALDVASREVLDVSQWMRTFAMQSLVGNDDTYSRLWRHNFRMFQRPSDDRMLAMPWDLDRSFRLSTSVSLWGGENIQKLIELPGSRRLFYGHALDMINTTCNAAYMSHWTTHYGALLGQNFSSHLSWIGDRSAYVLGQIPVDQTTFTVTNVGLVVSGDTVTIGGQAGVAIEDIFLNGLEAPLDTWWTRTGSGTAQTFYWHATVPVSPGVNALTLEGIGFQGELVGTASVTITSTASERPLFDNLRVTEVMYNPAGSDDAEFIELHNSGTTSLDLSEVSLSDGITFAFAGSAVTQLDTGAYVVVVRDLAEFATRYDTNALLVAGEYSGRLADGGERITVSARYGEVIVSFSYNDSRVWPAAADGAGHALVPLTYDGQNTGALDYGPNWRAGTYIGGSPGHADPVRQTTVKLNEVMAHTDYTNGLAWQDSNDWIELYNGSASPVSLADWYLSDDDGDLKKWAIPAALPMAPFTWRVFDEVTHFHPSEFSGFGLNKDGEQVFLSHLPGTSEDRVVDAIVFKGQENEISFGRYVDGDASWYRLQPTLGSTNALAGGDIVIDEIMYHPARKGIENPTNEFIELFNPLQTVVPLSNGSGSWRISGGVDFVLPPATAMAPGERLVVVSFDPSNAVAMAAFRAAYDLPQNATVLGPYEGRLSNAGDRLALERPQASDDPFNPDDVSWVVVDETTYWDQAPWPEAADGADRPLQRLHPRSAGNAPSAWIAAGAASPAAPPFKATIVSPFEGQAFLVPFDTTVSVSVESGLVSGSLQQVGLMLNDSTVGVTNDVPYTFPVSGISASTSNRLQAFLVDDSGTNVSPVVTFHAFTNAPFAMAGVDLFANLTVGGTVSLNGTLEANGFPVEDITTTWALQEGPAPVGFNDALALQPTAYFSTPGDYILRLTIDYNGLRVEDTVTVSVSSTNIANAIPYDETFEAYAISQNLNGIHGWVGQATVYTNETPHGHPGPHPMPAAQHGQSLRSGGDTSVEFVHTDSPSNTWVDVLIECVPRNTDAPPAFPQEAPQFATYVTSSNALAVWHTQGGGQWSVLPDISLVTGQWVRLTVNLDYTADPDRYRLWVDGTAVTNPQTWFVSGKTNANHLLRARAVGQYRLDDLVVDDYDVLHYRKVTTARMGEGQVVPEGDVLVPIGGDTNIIFTASPYHHVGQITVDQVALLTNAPLVSVSLTNTLSRRRVEGLFQPNLTPTHGVPEGWLAGLNPAWTNAFDALAEGDADGDGHFTWQEFIAGTHPTSGVDVFALEVITSNGVPTVMFEARAAGPELEGRQRYYTLELNTQLGSGTWSEVSGHTNILGANQTVVHTNAEPRAVYRARARIAPAP